MTQRHVQLLKRWAGILAVLLPALGWGLNAGAGAVDTRYLHRSEFQLTHQRDSINTSADLKEIRNDVNTLVRACRKRGECP